MPEPRSSSSGTSTVLIVLLIVGAVGLVLLVVCGGLILLGVGAGMILWQRDVAVMKEEAAVRSAGEDVLEERRRQELADSELERVLERDPKRVAERFLTDLSLGRVQQAYEATTTAFKKRRTEAQFRAMLFDYPGLKGYNLLLEDLTRPATDTAAHYRFSTMGPELTDVNFQLSMAKEDGAWKVDRFEPEGK